MRDEYESAYFDGWLGQAIEILGIIRRAKTNIELQGFSIAVLAYSSLVAMILVLGH